MSLVTVNNLYENGVCDEFTIYTGTTYNGDPYIIPVSAQSIGSHSLPHTFDVGGYEGPLYIFLVHCDFYVTPPPSETPKRQGGFQVKLINIDCENCPPFSPVATPSPTSTPNATPTTDCNFTVNFVEYSPAPSPTPQPSATSNLKGATPTPSPTPNPTPNATPDATPDATPVATPLPTDGSTPQPTPDATPVATPDVTPNATQIPTYTPIPSPSATPLPSPSPSPTTEVSALTCNFVFVPNNVDTTNQGLDYFQGGETAILTPFSNLLATLAVYQGVSGSVYSVCSQTTPLWFDFGQSGGGAAVTDPSGVERPPSGGSCTQNRNCTYEQEPSPTPQPTPEATAETTEISAILLSNTTSAPNNANCDEGNDGVLENRVFVLYNTTWFTTNASGKNVVKSTFSLTDNEIINGGDSSYTIHPDSIWTGGPSVFRNSSDGTYMIADSSTEGTEKLLFQKNGNYGTTNKCGGGPGGFN